MDIEYLEVSMILTYKTKIYPNTQQELLLWDLSEQCRLLYNFALTERRTIYEQERDNPYRRYTALLSLHQNGKIKDSDFILI